MIDLSDEARKLFAPGKGLLAADESNKSADKRLESFGIAPSEEMRRKDRDLFIAAPGIEKYLSGVILYSETAAQNANDGTPFRKLLADRGVIPGIKVDEGLEPISEKSKEVITQGLIGLSERLVPYAAQGFGFTKWRAVIRIEGEKLPTAHALVENAKRLASYALMVQRAGMVPILEPEVLLEGTHSRLRAKAVIIQTLKTLFAALEDQAVDLSGIIVKTSMALSGDKSGKKDAPQEVAEDTVEALIASVPKQVPGIVFLSGGQTPEQAIENLGAICGRARGVGASWPLTYSFSRAFQEEALVIWKGGDENVPKARGVYLARLKQASEVVVS